MSVVLEQKKLLSPLNSGCDKVDECKYATAQCYLPINPEFKPKQPVVLSVAPSRRYTHCQGYAETLGISFSELKTRFKDEQAPPTMYTNTPYDGHSCDYIPTFEGGDTYRCKKCGRKLDMTEDEDP